jgi:uncharacterized protein YecT (DUF1311 family)
MKVIHIAGLILLASQAIAQHNAANKMSEAEVQSAIKDSSDCDELKQIQIDHLEYFDFDEDGQQDAVVIASTCMTGTAGPDIHAVYRRNAESKLIEMPFREPYGDPFFRQNGPKLPVFGNPNYGLTAENGMLVARWMDSSDRETPLVIWYKWSGKEFIADHMKVQGPFVTSYDCTKAEKDIDRAICYSPSVAALDLELGRLYRERLKQFSPEQKQKLQQQQRDWITNRDKECVIYKWWVECLSNLYQKRIAELKETASAK